MSCCSAGDPGVDVYCRVLSRMCLTKDQQVTPALYTPVCVCVCVCVCGVCVVCVWCVCSVCCVCVRVRA